MSAVAIADAPKRDDFNAVCREKFGLPEQWQWVSLNCHEQPEDFIRIKGGVYEQVKAGKRKGKPNFRKPLPGTEQVVFIRESELKDWRLRKEAETGRCWVCDGSGQQWCGWSAAEGNRYRTCSRCAGSGKAPTTSETKGTEG